MTALLAIVIFFFIYVLVYMAISVVISTAAWWMRNLSKETKNAARIQDIDQKIDWLKERSFFISIILAFFIVTPFAVIWILTVLNP